MAASEDFVNNAVSALRGDLTTTNTALTKTQRQQFDISKSLGLEREQKSYQTRLEALTHSPGDLRGFSQS